ncbi:MAG TPA: hypothetical protein VF076_05945 [Acidimicrobiales bacterium]
MALADDLKKTYSADIQRAQLNAGKKSRPFTQMKGARAGQTYRVARGLSGNAVRVYNPGDSGKSETALVPGAKKPAAKATDYDPSLLEEAASKKHGGQKWLYRRGASGRLIPVRKAS